MVQGYPYLEDVSVGGDERNAPLVTEQRAVLRGREGEWHWVAHCPRCVESQEEGLLVGDGATSCVTCTTCGAIIEVRESGVYRAAPTLPPPKE